ncbi:MAG: cysteine--tRNA ligase [Candidatus Thermoplasmatota archaeon]|nr:cysteine--tRNA ligase [Candidatus Thermoplasmatota archaeon]
MALHIYNTLSRTKEDFVPLRGKRVNMFVCGITPYDYTHVGHARTYVTFDVVARYLRHRGYSVFYVQNVTDVDDRIVTRSAESGTSWDELGNTFLEDYLETMRRLRVTSVNLYARATEYIPEIIEQVGGLVEKGFAYQVDGDVFYEVNRYPSWGQLSRVKQEKLRAGARVEVDERKRDPRDFALWKAKKPGEPTWDSPWGPGRPGWHIEDTAITITRFGPQYDIHGAATDLIFPHHEAEIAQAESFTGVTPFVKYWMHGGFVVTKGERMGKSLGNIVPVQDALDRVEPEVLRFFLVNTQYRGPIDFTFEALDEAQSAYARLTEALGRARGEREDAPKAKGRGDAELRKALKHATQAFQQTMDDDFNTRDALGALFQLTTAFNTAVERGLSQAVLQSYLDAFDVYGRILGLFRTAAGVSSELLQGLVRLLVGLREEAREKGDFETSDRVRKALGDLGIELQDTSKGPRWRLT